MADGLIYKPWTLTIGQVAQMFGESEPTFRKRLGKRLEGGFPPRLPGSKDWSRPVVEDWFRSNGKQSPIEPVKASALDEARQELEGRYAAAS